MILSQRLSIQRPKKTTHLSINIDSQVPELRIGNVNWCICGKCEPMKTEAESFCCLDANEVPDEYFEDKNNNFIRLFMSALACSKHFLIIPGFDSVQDDNNQDFAEYCSNL